MKFGIREIADVVFKAKKDTWIGNSEFKKGQPVLYIDSAKTSTIEGAATTVYATGGRGNSRLITWEGEKTLTFTVEDALLSPIGFSILSGAGLFNAGITEKAMIHRTEMAEMIVHVFEKNDDNPGAMNTMKLEIYVDALTSGNNKISDKAPIFVSVLQNGSLISNIKHLKVDTQHSNCLILKAIDEISQSVGEEFGNYYIQPLDNITYNAMLSAYGLNPTMFPERNGVVYKFPCIVDYYTEKQSQVTELVIDADNFGGYYYVEGTTYVRNENGKDMKMTLTFPKVKVQSNFTFNMTSSGDPSTFSFVMDAMPDYTIFESTKKVLCAMQLIEEEEAGANTKPVLTLGKDESVDANIRSNDSVIRFNFLEDYEEIASQDASFDIQGGSLVYSPTDKTIAYTDRKGQLKTYVYLDRVTIEGENYDIWGLEEDEIQEGIVNYNYSGVKASSGFVESFKDSASSSITLAEATIKQFNILRCRIICIA